MRKTLAILLCIPCIGFAETFVDVTATGGGRYECRVDGQVVSTHSQEHKASSAATNLKLTNPESAVVRSQNKQLVATLTSAGRVLLEGGSDPTPDPVPEPEPDPIPDPDPNPEPDPTPDPIPTGSYRGIPLPSFGIDQSVPNESYTYWVDNTGPCADSTNGSRLSPRCSVPANLQAGDIVQLRGGPYSEMRLNLNGTFEEPVFFRGPTGEFVEFQGREGLELNGRYFIIENVDIARIQSEGNSFYAVRDSKIHEPTPGTGGMIGILDTDAVFLRIEAWGNGSVQDPKDRHGFNIYGGDRIWILDSQIYFNGGDAIQTCHGCVNAGNGGVGALYIANNIMHSDKENAIDLKEFTGPIIISGNEMYNYFRITSGQGEAIRINDEGNQGDVWMIGNNIHDSNICINPDDSRARSYAIDNVCRNNNFGIIDGLTGRGGNLINGVSDGDPSALYRLFEDRYGISID